MYLPSPSPNPLFWGNASLGTGAGTSDTESRNSGAMTLLVLEVSRQCRTPHTTSFHPFHPPG